MNILPTRFLTTLSVLLLALPGIAEAAARPAPPAAAVASTLLPADEVPDERYPGTALLAWGGQAYRRIGDRYYDENGDCWMALTVTTTCYVPVVEQCNADPEHTATMTKAYTTYGIAADPDAIPYGTVMRVPGYGEFKVDDTGKAMRRSWDQGVVHLDLRIPFQRFDGLWRDAATCNRIARKHGVQEDRIVLVQVECPVMAAVEAQGRSIAR